MADVLTPPSSRRQRVYRGRFLLVYLALGIVLGGAVTGLLVVLDRPGAERLGPWSTWRPTAAGSQRLNEIAKYVSDGYHLPSGRQLVGVIAGPPQVQDIPIKVIAVRTGLGTSRDDISILGANGSIVYHLCGLGKNCSINEGKVSVERARLLRREALELALYTFRYVDGIDSIIAFLPPAPGSNPDRVLFLQRDDLRNQLERPLAHTLPKEKPPLPNAIPPKEVSTIDGLTGKRLFKFDFQQAADGSAILILDPTPL